MLLSLVFFIYYLYRIDYLSFRGISLNPYYLGLSVLFLWAGFIGSALSWGYALRVHGVPVGSKTAIRSHGLSVFSKYIPGKIWLILSRASRVSGKRLNMDLASMVSLKEGLVYILWGLIISIPPLIMVSGWNLYVLAVFATALGLWAILFSARIHKLSLNILSRILKKPVELPLLSLPDAWRMSRFILFYWLLWILAFFLFVRSFIPGASLLLSFAFPLSIAYGIIVLITPGGIGVREGIITAYLVMAGVPAETAVTLSIISRLWFISGEIFIFLFALIIGTGHHPVAERSRSHRLNTV